MFLVFKKGQESNKSTYVTKPVGVIVTITLKMSLNLLVNPLLHSFSTDHLNHKIINKITQELPQNPRELWAQ